MTPTADQVLDVFRTQIGTVEARDGSTPYHRWYGLPFSAPWCMAFQCWGFHQAGASELIHPKTAYTPTAADWFRARGRFDWNPRVGDLVFFDWPDSLRRIQHVGIVEAVEPGAIITIEGNTAPDDRGSQGNGGGVWRRRRARTPAIAGYGHPDYAVSPEPAAPPPPAPGTYPALAYGMRRHPRVRAVQQFMRRVFPDYAGDLPATGNYLDQTVRVIREFQAREEITGPDANGRRIGPRTWAGLVHRGYR